MTLSMRTIVDLPEAQIASLARICEREGLSRAELIRRAVAAYLETQAKSPDSGFGLWQNAHPDALELEDELRREWSP